MSKKEELMKFALELFAKEGYDNVGVQKIVDSAGVKKPTLYHYFGSKEGLIDAILAEKFLPFLEELSKISDYKGDIVLTLENIMFCYFRFAKENSDFYKLVLSHTYSSEKSQTYKSTMEYHTKQHMIIEKMFLEAEKQHGNMIGRSRMYTFSFIGMINSGISYYFYTKDEKDINEESGRQLCRQFMYGIFS